jgi:hypothetical protein
VPFPAGAFDIYHDDLVVAARHSKARCWVRVDVDRYDQYKRVGVGALLMRDEE